MMAAPSAVPSHGIRLLGFQVWAFVKRGFTHSSSYRLNFALSFVNVLAGLVSYYYLSRIVGTGVLGSFSNNAAGFIIAGTTFSTFVSVALASYSGSIRNEMFLGTLEHWLLSASTLTRLVVLSTLWEFLFPLVTTVVTFVVLALILGLNFDVNWPATLVFFLLTIVAMSGFGLISAGVIMISKVGDPLGTAWGIVTGLLSGALFPISVLPGWLQAISNLLPTYHALNGLRAALINHVGLGQQMHELWIMIGFCALTLPLGLLAFRAGFERARSQGTLGQF